MAQKITSPFGGYYIYPDDAHNLFQQLLGQKTPAQRESAGELSPAVDVYEDESSYHASVEMAGVNKSDIQISCTDNTVTINAKVERSAHENGRWVRQERRTGTYVCNIQFRTEIEADNISAGYSDGILSLTIPKQTADKRTVSVNID